MMARIEAPIVANQTLAAASAIFSWAMREEFAHGQSVRQDRAQHDTKPRACLIGQRDPAFWRALEEADPRTAALKFILLTGQRPGEVAHLRREHIKDGWWEMPGEPVPNLGWPGTKNGQAHRVWLPETARDLLRHAQARTGFAFSTSRGRTAVNGLAQAMRQLCKRSASNAPRRTI